MSEPEATAPPVAELGEVLVFTAKGTRERRRAADIRSHDFRQSGFLAASELRRIRQRHEQFVRSLAARLAIFLRLEFSLQLAKLQIVGYQKYTEGLPNPTHITLFKTDPLKGVSLLVVPPKMALTLVDRLLGGPGQPPETPRELSEIEVALFDQVAVLIFSEWCSHWPEMRDLHATLVNHESNSHFLQTATPDTEMMILTMTGGIGEQSETMQMVFPYPTVEPLLRQLSPALIETEAMPGRPKKPKWNAEFDGLTVPVSARWHGLKMSAGDVTRLKAGDVLALAPACAAQVQISLCQMPKFTGRPGTTDGRWAVQITGEIPNE